MKDYQDLNVTLVHTLKKKIEVLKESEEKFKNIFDNANDGIVVADAKTQKFVIVNFAFCKLLGYDENELYEMGVADIHPKKDLPYIYAQFEKQRQRKIGVTPGLPVLRKNGEVIYCDVSSSPVALKGRPFLMGFFRDVTGRKKAEEALRESEEKFKVIFNHTFEFIGLVNLDGVLTAANKTAVDSIGFKESEVIGKPFWETPWWSYSKKLQYRLRNAITQAKKGKIIRMDVMLATKDGSLHPVDFSLKPIKDSAGNVILMVPEGRDMTEQKKAEEKIALFKDAIDRSSDAIGMSTPEGKHYYQNKAFDNLFGNIGNNPPESVYVDKKVGHEIFNNIMSGKEWLGEVEMYGKHKQILTMLARANSIKDDKGKIMGLIGTHTDITERKKAEKALNERYKELQCIYNLGKIIETSSSNEIIFTRLTKDLVNAMQYPKEAVSKILFDSKVYPGGELCSCSNKLKEDIIVKGKKRGQINMCYKSKSILLKEEKVLLKAVAERIGKVVERTEAEEALRVSEEKFKSLFESSSDAVMMIAPPKWEFIAGNPATIKMFDTKTEKKFISLGPWDVSPKYQPDGQLSSVKAKEMIGKAMKTGKNFFEWTHRRLNGEDFLATVLLTRLEIGGKKLLQATVRDIAAGKTNR